MIEETINDDHIDKSHWLPKGEQIATPERIAKGDLKLFFDKDTGQIREAQATVKNILNYLWEENHITDQNHDDAHVFEAWRNQHLVSQGLKNAVSSEITEVAKVKLRAHGYTLLIRRLSNPDFHAILSSIETFATPHSTYMALIRKQTYRRALERLSSVLTPIRQRIDYLEGLTEDERNCLSEENLKIAIAEEMKQC